MNPMNRAGESTLYVWTERSDVGVQPAIGTLADYARACEMSDLSGDRLLSSSLWTWDDAGRPVEHVVEAERGPVTEECRIPITYRANGETVIYFADGAA